MSMPKKRRYQEDVAGRGLWADAWYRFKKNKLAVVGLTFVVILVCVSIGTIILDLATDNKVYEALVVK